MREWIEKEDYFDQYFRKIVRKKSDKATYGPQLLTWEILSELFEIVSNYRKQHSANINHLQNLHQLKN